MLFIAFWTIGFVPFVGQEIIRGFYDKLSSILLLLSDVTIVMLGLWLIRSKIDIIILVSFLILSYVSTCVFNDGSIMQYANGIRLYIGFIFIIPILRYFISDPIRRDFFVKKFDKNLYIFLWLQLPCSIIQCVQYGAFDQVGGTLGWMQSGEMSTLVYLISLYFMRKKWDDNKSYLSNIRQNWTLILLLVPSFLNETKISFVYLLLYFFFLLPMDRKFILRVVIVAPCVALVMSLMSVFYLYMGGKDNTFSQEFVEEYLFGDEDGRNYVEFILDNGIESIEDSEDFGDLARMIKFQAIPVVQEDEPHSTVIGFGVGIFRGGAVLGMSDFVKDYKWLTQGTRMMFYVFILELGYLGLVWYILFWLLMFKGNSKYRKNPQVLIYQIILILLIGMYNVAFANLTFSIIFMYILFVSVYHKPKIELKEHNRKNLMC